ncbi:hypothetical protein FOL47_008940 [Perkinsus chesapeaki]|uniref:MATH domain-containing protein n=1 Tax=Perkinsus chesapeaki TaxID=330153 RepID=A0A7J6N207_PERCH|nr:hypothetical protein FOL47_008940 [Perkinsus chesapeaki]
MSDQRSGRAQGEPRSVEWWVQPRLSEQERLYMLLSSLIIGGKEVLKTLRFLGSSDLVDALTARQPEPQPLVWTPRAPAIERCNRCGELKYLAISIVWARNLHYDGITRLPVDGFSSRRSDLVSENDKDDELDRLIPLPIVFRYVPLGAHCEVWQDLLNRFTESLKECADRCAHNILCRSGNYDVRSQRCQLSSMSCTAHIHYNQGKLSNVALFTADDDSLFSWECSADPLDWCRMSYSSNEWSPRAGHSLVVMGERLLLVGGHGVVNSSFTEAYMSREVNIGGDLGSSVALRDVPLGRLDDIWQFDTSMRKWRQLPVEGLSSGRSYHQVLAQEDRIEIYGGLTDLGNATHLACNLRKQGALKCITRSAPAEVSGRHCHGVLLQPFGDLAVFGGRSASGQLLCDVWFRNLDNTWRKGEHTLPFEGCIGTVVASNQVAILGIDSRVFCPTDRYLNWHQCSPLPFRLDHSKPVLVSLGLGAWIAVVGYSSIYSLDLAEPTPKWYRSVTFPSGTRLSAGATVFHGRLWITGGVTEEGYYDMSTWTIGVKQLIDSAEMLQQSVTPPARVFFPGFQAILDGHLSELLLTALLGVALVTGGWSQFLQTTVLVILLNLYIHQRMESIFNERQRTPEDTLKAIYENQIQASLAAGVSNLPLSSEPLSMTSTADLLCRTPPCSRHGSCKDSYKDRVQNVISDTMSSSGVLCCSDLQHQILRDILDVLNSLTISYTPIYGTLLGAVREKDHLPHTRDIDLVVSAANWSSIALELARRSSGGGRRRYITALDEWEPKVLRICADYSGWDPVWFSAVDSRDDTVSVYLDMYILRSSAPVWFLVEPLRRMYGVGTVALRELNLTAVAFPLECLEKLFGMDWTEPVVALEDQGECLCTAMTSLVTQSHSVFVTNAASNPLSLIEQSLLGSKFFVMVFLLPPQAMEGVLTAEFQVPASAKETMVSPVMTTESFNFRVEVRQSNNSEDYLGVFLHFEEKKGSYKAFPLGRDVKMEVHILNHQDASRPIVKSFCRKVYPSLIWGWPKFVEREALADKKIWLDQQDNIIFQIRASVVEEDPNRLNLNEHEVRFDGREEYGIGDEFKSPPTWKGNYKFQVAVYPGGISTNPKQQPFLAAYIHLLDRLDTGEDCGVQLKMKALNHKDFKQSIKWTAIHTFDTLRSSWGCPELIPLEALRKEGSGWLNEDQEIKPKNDQRPKSGGKRARVGVLRRSNSSVRSAIHDRLALILVLVLWSFRCGFDGTSRSERDIEVHVKLKGAPFSKAGYLAAYVYFEEKKGSVNVFPLGSKVKYSIELVNHTDQSRSIAKEFSRFVYPGLSNGWRRFAHRSELSKKNDWLDEQGKLVFRATASVVKEDPDPLKPNEHEVRFNGREEYDIGDEFKSPPTWKGNYKFQVVVYPGGADTRKSTRSVAAYLHLLGQRGNKSLGILKLKIKLINHKNKAKSIRWTSIHTFNNEDRTWGCPALIPIDQLRNETLGWINDSGEAVLRVSVSASLPAAPDPNSEQPVILENSGCGKKVNVRDEHPENSDAKRTKRES